MTKKRIAVGVGGRFHADQMVAALTKAGHETTLFTSFPFSRFAILKPFQVKVLLFPEIVFRAARALKASSWGDQIKAILFGKRLAKTIQKKGSWDLVVGWSSFALETFRLKSTFQKVLVRDSAHIDFQNEVLAREYGRLGIPYPDRRVTAERELAEYALADYVLVPSRFAARTFVEKGFAPEKLKVLHLGVNTSVFRAGTIEAEAGPLRVVYFGSLSIQKGIHHLLEATKDLSPETISLTLVGAIDDELRPIMAKYSHFTHHPPMPHDKLATFLRSQEVFVMPSLHDGFGLVVPQALASGLVVLVSDHCGAQEIVENGVNGFIFETGNTRDLKDKLSWLNSHRDQTVKMRRQAASTATSSGWSQYASELGEWVNLIANPDASPASY